MPWSPIARASNKAQPGRGHGAQMKDNGDETHLSALEPGPQAASRVSCPHGDQSRPQDFERAPRQGPGVDQRLIAAFGDYEMTPSGAMGTETGPLAPAALSCVASMPVTLRKRADFLRAASARRQGTPGFLVQARERGSDEGATGIRIGFTCSKKVGNSVMRNRARRRLREVARAVLPREGQAGWDYVLVGRPGATVVRDFAALIDDLHRALARIHADGAGKPALGQGA